MGFQEPEALLDGHLGSEAEGESGSQFGNFYSSVSTRQNGDSYGFERFKDRDQGLRGQLSQRPRS